MSNQRMLVRAAIRQSYAIGDGDGTGMGRPYDLERAVDAVLAWHRNELARLAADMRRYDCSVGCKYLLEAASKEGQHHG